MFIFVPCLCNKLHHLVNYNFLLLHVQMNKSYYKSLFAKLKSDDKAALPVLDPTQGTSAIR